MRFRPVTLFAVVGMTAFAMAIAGCGDSGTESDEEIAIGFSPILPSGTFFGDLNRGAKQAAERLGVDLRPNNPNAEPAAQANAVDTFIQQGVDALIVDAVDPRALQGPFEQARNQDVPIVAVDDPLVGNPLVSARVAHDSIAVSAKLAEDLLDDARATGTDPVIQVITSVDSPLEQRQVKGFLATVKGQPGVQVFPSCDAKYSEEKAATCAENALTAHQELRYFFAPGGIYADGILAAMTSQKADRVKLFNWDLTDRVAEGIKEGVVVEAVKTNALEQGTQAVEIATKLARGEKVRNFTKVPVEYVTHENVDEATSTP